MDAYTFSLSGGYLLKMHLSKFYLNTGLSVGFGVPMVKSTSKIKVDYSIKVNLKLAMGYEGKKLGTGLYVVNDSDAFEFATDNTIQYHSIFLNLFVSYKF
ncbi:MAG: hypothetical protein AB7E36_10520 [Salinivirgaceae bacterium]